MTSVSVAPAPSRTPGIRGRVSAFLRTALRVLGLLVLAALALLHPAVGGQLGFVSAFPSGRTETEALRAPSWWVVVALIAFGMALAPQWGRVGVDLTQLLAGLVLVTLPWPARAFWDSLPFHRRTPDARLRCSPCSSSPCCWHLCWCWPGKSFCSLPAGLWPRGGSCESSFRWWCGWWPSSDLRSRGIRTSSPSSKAHLGHCSAEHGNRSAGMPKAGFQGKPALRGCRDHPAYLAWNGTGQNADSGTSIRALSVASAIARSAAIFGRTLRAKNDAAAILPW